uniref:Hedgehog/Intein (Hint) domain-containing protein n=1 Tax=viral metagenome TaxID=1070528 RepID=A0A6C0JDV4_9ZZZZ
MAFFLQINDVSFTIDENIAGNGAVSGTTAIFDFTSYQITGYTVTPSIDWWVHGSTIGKNMRISTVSIQGDPVTSNSYSITLADGKNFNSEDNVSYSFTKYPLATASLTNGNHQISINFTSDQIINDLTTHYSQVMNTVNPNIVDTAGYYVQGYGANPDVINGAIGAFTYINNDQYNVQINVVSGSVNDGNQYFLSAEPLAIVPTLINETYSNIATFPDLIGQVDYCQVGWLANSYNLSNVEVKSINSGVVSVPFGTQIDTNPPTHAVYFVPCFKEGTKILCLIGNVETYIEIQDLEVGTLVKTYLHGYQKISMIGSGVIKNPEDDKRIKDRLYKYSNNDFPEDLVLTGGHSILVDELTEEQKEKTSKYWKIFHKTDDKHRLLAVVDENAVPYEIPGSFNIYHIALEHDDDSANYGIYANGLLVESCCKRALKNKINITTVE